MDDANCQLVASNFSPIAAEQILSRTNTCESQQMEANSTPLPFNGIQCKNNTNVFPLDNDDSGMSSFNQSNTVQSNGNPVQRNLFQTNANTSVRSSINVATPFCNSLKVINFEDEMDISDDEENNQKLTLGQRYPTSETNSLKTDSEDEIMSESDEPNSTPMKTFDTVVRRYPKPTNTNSTPPKSSKPSISETSKKGFFNRLLGKSKKPDTISSQESNKPEFNQFSSAIPAPKNSPSINSVSINSISINSVSNPNRIDSPKLTPKQRRFKETKRFQEATSLQFSPLGSPKHFNGLMRPRSSSFTKKNCTPILTEQDQIKAAIEKAEEARSRSTSIVGDFSRDSTVATVPGKHPDLTYISLETMVEMLESDVYEDQDYIIVDCRYPFEFNGGKIKSARNLYTWPLVKEEIYDKFSVSDHTPIIIFHCEFSSERAPKMYRTFRNFDRQEHQFPELKFPELYILKTGYKQFFEEYKEFCEGEYILMADPRFSEELKHFRRGKSQTWTAHQNNPHKARRSTEKHVSRFRTKF